MIRKYKIGNPFETEAVTVAIDSHVFEINNSVSLSLDNTSLPSSTLRKERNVSRH